MTVTKKNIVNGRNFEVGRWQRDSQGNRSIKEKVRTIVLHTYNGKGTSLYSWFNNNSRQVSAHYAVMKNGSVEQYVDDKNTAYHSGHAWWNSVSIGIEHQDDGNYNDDERTNELYEASAQLVFTLCRRHGLTIDRHGIRTHRDVSATGCPGGLDTARIIKRAQQLMDELNEYKKQADSQKKRAEKAEKALADAQKDIDTTNDLMNTIKDSHANLLRKLHQAEATIAGYETKTNFLHKLNGIVRKVFRKTS